MPSFNLSLLPREICDKIYASALDTYYTNETPPQQNSTHLSLLTTNRQIHDEVLQVFYSSSHFHIHTSHPIPSAFFSDTTTPLIRRVEIEYLMTATKEDPKKTAYCHRLTERLCDLTYPRKCIRITPVRRRFNSFLRFCDSEICKRLGGMEEFESVVVVFYTRVPSRWSRLARPRDDGEDRENTRQMLWRNLGEARMWQLDHGTRRALFLGFGRQNENLSWC